MSGKIKKEALKRRERVNDVCTVVTECFMGNPVYDFVPEN